MIKIASFGNSDNKIIVEEGDTRADREESLKDKLSSVMKMKKMLND